MTKRQRPNVQTTSLAGGCKLLTVEAWDMNYSDPEPLRKLAKLARDCGAPLTARELAWLRGMSASASYDHYVEAFVAWRRGVARTAGAVEIDTSVEQRVERFRSLVFEGINKALAKSPRGKSYEGTVLLHWPSYLEVHNRTAVYKLSLSCSVLCPEAPHSAWEGKTWSEVFAKATRDVERWIAELDAPAKPKKARQPRKPMKLIEENAVT